MRIHWQMTAGPSSRTYWLWQCQWQWWWQLVAVAITLPRPTTIARTHMITIRPGSSASPGSYNTNLYISMSQPIQDLILLHTDISLSVVTQVKQEE